MSLQVWLPLNGDLHNQGLSDITVTNNGATVDNNGKIGQCYYFNASTYLNESSYDWTNFNVLTFSLCCWYKEPSPVASGNSQMICIGTNSGWNNIRIGLLRRTSNGYPMFSVSDGSAAVQYSFTADSFPLDTWTHIACTYNNGIMKMYLNGELHKTYTTTIVPVLNSSQHLGVGAASNGAEKLTGYLNDVRIYDHCLSPKEVEEISKGLVLHYKLDNNGLGPDNLIKNGFGELGTENWNNGGSISTTDIPSGQPDIKASYNGSTLEKIYIYPNHTYKFSAWIKATSTSGNTYPSLFPYDVDDKFINNYNCPDGFNLNTMTTLKQQLKNGDTKIYVNDLSQWNANSGHYYNWAAIFSYTDGNGYTYPDGTYTQNMGQFGSSTNAKTNLDKTNNVITLLRAYTGPTMPVGTKVCASTEGSTYFYPLGGFNLANIQDWTYKEAIVSGGHNRLRYAKYVMFFTYYYNRMAGIKLEDLTLQQMNSNIVYDSSGYNNNGEIINTLSTITDSPKYTVCTHISATNQKIHISNFPTSGFGNSYSFAWWGKRNDNGPMFWGFSDGIRLNGMYVGYLWNTGDGSNNPIYKPGTTTNITAPSVNVWHHYVMTGDGTTCKLYLDGEFYGQAKTYKAISGTSIYINGWDSGTSYCSNNTDISDFRIYATALTLTQVKELYDTSASVDSDGNIYAREVVE